MGISDYIGKPVVVNKLISENIYEVVFENILIATCNNKENAEYVMKAVAETMSHTKPPWQSKRGLNLNVPDKD
jgi:hypothetical protein